MARLPLPFIGINLRLAMGGETADTHIDEMTLPRVQPMIPARRREPFDDPDWLFEFKYDGFRGLCNVERDRGRFISRNGNRHSRFDALADQVAAALDADEAILDGEVIVADATGRPQFYDLLRHKRAPAYVAFDMLWLDGTDLRSLPLSERRRRLQTVLPKRSEIVSEALSVVGKGRELFTLMCAHDLEGIVAKRLHDPYRASIQWLKITFRRFSPSKRNHRGWTLRWPRIRSGVLGAQGRIGNVFIHAKNRAGPTRPSGTPVIGTKPT
jgi:ATP-dependent DNA ligase